MPQALFWQWQRRETGGDATIVPTFERLTGQKQLEQTRTTAQAFNVGVSGHRRKPA